jgi:hypothetical protein
MSNEKPTATAIIRFFSTGKVEVELDSLVGVSPRKLAIAENLLAREFIGKKGAHNAKRHREAREAEVAAEEKKTKDDEKFHKREDKRLVKAAITSEEKGITRLEGVIKAAKKRLKDKKAKKESDE